MQNPRSCKKCGHLNLQATHAELEACPECDAIYTRVEAAIKEGKTVIPTPKAVQPPPPVTPVPAAVKTPQAIPTAPTTPPPIPAAPVQRTPVTRPYIEELREQSNYPTFRSFVGFCTGFGYIIAAIVAIGALMALTTRSAGAGGIGIALAIFIFILTKFGKEAALMLADLSDAATVIAENSKPKLL